MHGKAGGKFQHINYGVDVTKILEMLEIFVDKGLVLSHCMRGNKQSLCCGSLQLCVKKRYHTAAIE